MADKRRPEADATAGGTLRMPNWVWDVVKPRLHPYDWAVFEHIWRKTEGWGKASEVVYAYDIRSHALPHLAKPDTIAVRVKRLEKLGLLVVKRARLTKGEHGEMRRGPSTYSMGPVYWSLKAGLPFKGHWLHWLQPALKKRPVALVGGEPWPKRDKDVPNWDSLQYEVKEKVGNAYKGLRELLGELVDAGLAELDSDGCASADLDTERLAYQLHLSVRDLRQVAHEFALPQARTLVDKCGSLSVLLARPYKQAKPRKRGLRSPEKGA